MPKKMTRRDFLKNSRDVGLAAAAGVAATAITTDDACELETELEQVMGEPRDALFEGGSVAGAESRHNSYFATSQPEYLDVTSILDSQKKHLPMEVTDA